MTPWQWTIIKWMIAAFVLFFVLLDADLIF